LAERVEFPFAVFDKVWGMLVNEPRVQALLQPGTDATTAVV